MSYHPWEPRHRLTTIAPGRLDLFVVTLINGRRAASYPVTEYDDALAKARAFHQSNPCQIKVLPLTALEFRNMFGIDAGAAPSSDEERDRACVIDALMRVARDGSDPDARTEAFDMLVLLGAVPQPPIANV